MSGQGAGGVGALAQLMEELDSFRKELQMIGRGRPQAAFGYAFVYSLADWWEQVTGDLPAQTRGTSKSGRTAKREIFFAFVDAARTNSEIPGTSMDSAIKNVVAAMRTGAEPKDRKRLPNRGGFLSAIRPSASVQEHS